MNKNKYLRYLSAAVLLPLGAMTAAAQTYPTKPVRLIVPGWGGTASIKWLTEMRVDSHQHWVRLNTRGEAYIGPDYQAPAVGPTDEFIGGVTPADVKGPMVTWMPIKSVITVPFRTVVR